MFILFTAVFRGQKINTKFSKTHGCTHFISHGNHFHFCESPVFGKTNFRASLNETVFLKYTTQKMTSYSITTTTTTTNINNNNNEL